MSLCTIHLRDARQCLFVGKPARSVTPLRVGNALSASPLEGLPFVRRRLQHLTGRLPRLWRQGATFETARKSHRWRVRPDSLSPAFLVASTSEEGGGGNGTGNPVIFTTQYIAQFGQAVRVVGSGEELGSWNPSNAPGMVWSEGDIWKLTLDLPPGVYEYKLVVDGDPSPPVWEDGDNRILEVPQSTGGPVIVVDCVWGLTTSESIPAPTEASPSSGPVVPPEVDAAPQAFEGASVTELEEGTSQPAVVSSSEPTVEDAEEVPLSVQEQAGEGVESPAFSLEVEAPRDTPPDPVDLPPAAVAAEPAQAAVPSLDKSPISEANQDPEPIAQELKDGGVVQPVLPLLVGALGLFAAPLVAYSEWTLYFTGCGLPPGPAGLLGAAEGVSYLLVAGTVVWSVVTRARTGRGLPAGPLGLLGLFEGISYLLVTTGIVVAGLQVKNFGYIPGALPDSRCYGPDAPTPPPLPSLEALQKEVLNFGKNILP
eukprot:jgi/Botrbrau1/3101/Bobra.0070s0085.1